MPANEYSEADIAALLRRCNPWWSGRSVMPSYTPRRIFDSIWQALNDTSQNEPLLLWGIHGSGKTTLLHHIAMHLVAENAPATHVIYVPFDHPLLKMVGIEAVVEAWSHATPSGGMTYFLFDEILHVAGWREWLERHVNPTLKCRFVLTSSIRYEQEEKKKGNNWPIYEIGPLSFREYVDRTGSAPPNLPADQPLRALFSWRSEDFDGMAALAHPLAARFTEYMVRGGFPETLSMSDSEATQRYIREHVVDRVIKTEIAAFHGVRRVNELERLFLYLCKEPNRPVELLTLSGKLGISKNTVRQHLRLLEAGGLIQQLPMLGYGEEVRRGRFKVFLADPAMASALFLKGREALEDDDALSCAAEACAFHHVSRRDPSGGPTFSYWKNRSGESVSFIATGGAGQHRPFQVCYGNTDIISESLRGLARLCADKQVRMTYVITRRMEDFGPITLPAVTKTMLPANTTPCMQIPAALFCYWMS